MTEQWSQWEPKQKLARIYYISGIFNNVDSLKIELTEVDEKHKVVVLFKSFVDAYRVTYETYRCSLVSELGEKHGNYFYDWTFFKVENSLYIKWLADSSNGVIDSSNMMHFSFIDNDFVLDVVATYNPIVEIVNEQ